MLHKDAHVVFFSPAERNARLEYNLIVGHTGTYVTATFLLGFVAMFSRSNLFPSWFGHYRRYHSILFNHQNG